MSDNKTFITDRWLVPESRVIQDDEGQDRLITLERRYWAAFDFLAVESHATGPELVGAAFRDAPRQNMSFEDSLINLISWMDNEYRQQPGIWNRNLGKPNVAGHIGSVSKMQIKDIESQKHTFNDDA